MAFSLSRRAVFLGLFILIFGTLLLCEVAGHLYIVALTEASHSPIHSPFHFFRASSNRELAYELKPNTTINNEHGHLHINALGIRDDEESFPKDKPVLGILGDSVVFGLYHTQSQTIPHLLQEKLRAGGSNIRVMNLGVPGYGLSEFPPLLKEVLAKGAVTGIVFILNPNDFTQRDSVYEGADNGLYRMYRHPQFVLPYIARKLVYRSRKNGNEDTVEWYRWIFDGTKRENLPKIKELAEIAKKHGVAFKVALFPAVIAYTANGYELQRMYSEIESYLKDSQIDYVSWVAPLKAPVFTFLDETNHPTNKGDDLIVGLLVEEAQDMIRQKGLATKRK